MSYKKPRAPAREAFLSALLLLPFAASSCFFPGEDDYGPVSLPRETALVREIRLSGADGSRAAAFSLATFGGTYEEPCVQVGAARGDAMAGSGDSVLILSSATSAAYRDSYTGLLLFGFYDADRRLVRRAGDLVAVSGPGDYAALVPSAAGDRWLVLSSSEAAAYALSGGQAAEGARLPLSGLTGDARTFLRALAGPAGGYAAIAYDGFLRREVLSLLGEDLGVVRAAEVSWDGYPLGAGMTAGGEALLLSLGSSSIAGRSYVLSRFGSGSGLSVHEGALPVADDYRGERLAFAGDRFWLHSDSLGGFVSVSESGVTAAGGGGLLPDGSYAFVGAADGGLIAYGPVEPDRGLSAGPSPPYSAATLSVVKLRPDLTVAWRQEWTESRPARILAVAEAASGEVAVFLCERPR